LITLISWIGNVFIVAGLWFVGGKKRWAWYFSMAGESLWIAFSLFSHLWSLAFICAVFLAMAIRNWIVWGRQ
jgi:hypothetical protein